jgi:hypothetical protein
MFELHPGPLAADANALGLYKGILGVNAARLGKWTEARHAFFSSARTAPTDYRRWLRLVLACAPPAGARVWARN